MDLIGHDTNFAVTQSVYDANFADKRYVPSLVQREMVDGGLLGQQVGAGLLRLRCRGERDDRGRAGVHGAARARRRDRRAARARRRRRALGGAWRRPASLRGRPLEPLERPADRRRRVAPRRRPCGDAGARRTPAFATSPSSTADRAWRRRTRHAARAGVRGDRLGRMARAGARSGCAIAGWQPQRVGDAPGLVVARTVAMLINEGADAVQQGVCTPEGADLAMKLGVNHPAGPFEFLARWDARSRRDAARPRSTRSTAASATASAPGCASAPGSRRSTRRLRKTDSRSGVGRWRDRLASARRGAPDAHNPGSRRTNDLARSGESHESQ